MSFPRGSAAPVCGLLALATTLLACQRTELERSAEALLARARALRTRAADFEQDRALAALAPNPHNGTYLRFDDRLTEARASGTPIPAPEAPGFGFEFEGDDPVPLRPRHAQFVVADGMLRITGHADAFVTTVDALDLDPTDYAEIQVRIRLRHGTQFELGWGSAVGSPGRLRIDAADDGEFHVYKINTRTGLRRRMPPGERIRMLSLRPSNRSDDQVEIDYLRFIPKLRRYAAAPFGRGYESRGDELRSVLYMGSPLRLQFPARVPRDAPRLSFGTGVLAADDPVRFAVRVVSGDEETEVYASTQQDAERWRDAEIDLSPWAGRRVEIAFLTASERGNVAFWTNPILFGAPPERFNVIVLLEDALRADHVSAYGYGRPTSPAKDALAARGVLFENAFAQAPTTRPSCPSIMTSLYPSATGVWTHEQMLDDRFVTLAEVLRSQGFATASFVQNSNAGRSSGLHQGFSYLFERPTTEGYAGVYEGPVAEWLERHGHRNFFLYLHVIDPHGVYDPPKPWRTWYQRLGDGQIPVPADRRAFDPRWVSQPTLQGRISLYDGEIRNNDAWLGRLLERLERAGGLEDTLIVFLADHGEHFAEHLERGASLEGHRPPGYVQVLHVPLIMVRPGVLPAGRRVAAPVQLVDVVPTLLEIAGIDTAGLPFQGESLLPLIRGEREEYWSRRIAISEEPYFYQGPEGARISASAFYGSQHLLHSQSQGTPELLLYDYRADPQEQSPLEGRAHEREVLADLLRALRSENLGFWREMTGEAPDVIEYDPDALDQLRELGYIE